MKKNKKKTKHFLSIYLLVSLLLASGCSMKECRNDLECWGGFYFTSHVDHIGTRKLEGINAYQSLDLIAVEARLVQWGRGGNRHDLGNRFIITNKDNFRNEILKNKSNIENYPEGKYLTLYKLPVCIDWQEDNIDLKTGENWYLLPDNLNEKLPNSVLKKIKNSMQFKPFSAEDDEIIFNDEDINCIVTTNYEDPYYKPFRSNCLKVLLYPPSIVIDVVVLPIIIVSIPIRYIIVFWGYGPGP